MTVCLSTPSVVVNRANSNVCCDLRVTLSLLSGKWIGIFPGKDTKTNASLMLSDNDDCQSNFWEIITKINND